MAAPFLAVLDDLGFPVAQVRKEFAQARLAIVGLEGHGAYVANLLSECGIGNLVLIDPFPCQPGNLTLMGPIAQEAVGKPREEVVKSMLLARDTNTKVVTGGQGDITRERIRALTTDCHALVSCFDKGFASSHFWVNEASLQHRVPAIFAESKGHSGLIGPLVLPDETACYMCYRMRSIANEDDYNTAMSYEEYLDSHKHPALHDRPVLPTMPPYIASVLVLEILKQLLSLNPTLAGRVMEFNALTLQTELHTVLQKPDCPVCQVKKKWWDRQYPNLEELKRSSDRPADLLKLTSSLFSPRTGIVRRFQRLQKDTSEPTVPYIFRSQLSNHRYLENWNEEDSSCSGKGISLESAQVSALGEAVERYSGACWHQEEILYARQGDLGGRALDPRRLVLYTPDQYGELPYVPYDGENLMGWARAYSLISGEEIFVPALAVFMNYTVTVAEEFICPVTSNGLAAGPTLLDAILNAAFEVLERDAFMVGWLNRLPCQQIDPWTHPDQSIVGLCEMYRRRGVETHLFRLPVDHPYHVFAAFGVQTNGFGGPAVVAGLGADFEATNAARKAILEVAQVRPALRRRLRTKETQARLQELIGNPQLVSTLDDHDLLYTSREAFGAFEFLLKRPLETFDWTANSPSSSTDKIQNLCETFSEKGWDLIYYNLTPPDVGAMGLYTTRVILPDFQPIDFGWKERRLGGTRLYNLPYQLGLAHSRSTAAQINPDPHPLA